jgi:predicted transcriptional regulator
MLLTIKIKEGSMGKNITTSFELPEEVKKRLIECARISGRKQTIIVRAALHHFITSDLEKQESLIKKYLESEK